MFKDYYEVLGVPPSATAEQIRSSFKQLALRLHPDKHVAAVSCGSVDVVPGAEQPLAVAFTEIQEAYEVLSDVARRYLYDLNYAELVAARNQLVAEEERRRYREQQARREQQRREREQAERELRERAAAVARAAAAVAAAPCAGDAGAVREDVPDAFSMTRTIHSSDPILTAHGRDAFPKAKSRAPKRRKEVAPLPLEAGERPDGAESAAPPLPTHSSHTITTEGPPPPLSTPHAENPAEGPSSSPDGGSSLPPRKASQRGPRVNARTAPPLARSVHRQCVSSIDLSSAAEAPASVKLPSLRLHKTVSLSFDSPRSPRDGARRGQRPSLPPNATRDRQHGEAYFHRRAVERTLAVFFADYGFGAAANAHSASV